MKARWFQEISVPGRDISDYSVAWSLETSLNFSLVEDSSVFINI